MPRHNPFSPRQPFSLRRRRIFTLPSSGALEPQINPQTKSYLFRLPPEIRLKIWELVLQGRSYVSLAYLGPVPSSWWRPSCYGPGYWPKSLEISYLLSCRRIYSELLSLLLRYVSITGFHPPLLRLLPDLFPSPGSQYLRTFSFALDLDVAPSLRKPSRGGCLPTCRDLAQEYWLKAKKRQRRAATVLSTVFKVLGSMHEINTVTLQLHALDNHTSEACRNVENEILDLINQARRGRTGWSLQVNWKAKGERDGYEDEGLHVLRLHEPVCGTQADSEGDLAFLVCVTNISNAN